MAEKVRWFGPKPERCQVCSGKIGPAADFVDGVIRFTERDVWAIACIKCHTEYGVGLGSGKGQRYNGFTLEKTEG